MFDHRAAQLLWSVSLSTAGDREASVNNVLFPNVLMDAALIGAGLRETEVSVAGLPKTSAAIGAVIR